MDEVGYKKLTVWHKADDRKLGLKLGLIGFELGLFSGTAKMSFLS